MKPRVIEESVKRIEDDMYFSSDSIKVRLARIEAKLENVVTKEDLEAKLENAVTKEDLEAKLENMVTKENLEANLMGLKAELIAHTNSTFRWTIGLYMVEAGVLLTVLKLT